MSIKGVMSTLLPSPPSSLPTIQPTPFPPSFPSLPLPFNQPPPLFPGFFPSPFSSPFLFFHITFLAHLILLHRPPHPHQTCCLNQTLFYHPFLLITKRLSLSQLLNFLPWPVGAVKALSAQIPKAFPSLLMVEGLSLMLFTKVVGILKIPFG